MIGIAWGDALGSKLRYYEFFAGAGMARAGLGGAWQGLFANDCDELKRRWYAENWEGEDFNLPHEISTRLGRLAGHEPVVVMHNDAVVQGLSEVRNMRDVDRWGVLTIGTGLGNARFTNRPAAKDR